MKQMFESATLKLTLWYLAIVMFICLFFSVIIYQISTSEVKTRLHIVEERFEMPLLPIGDQKGDYTSFQKRQLKEAQTNLFVALFYSNLSILLIGGVGSYILARRTLQPIEELQDAQARFTSDASHELRTPLAVMKSELEVAKRSKNMTKQDMQELIDSNLEEVNRLTDLSDMLLKLSKHEFSQVDMQAVNLVTIIQKVIVAQKKAGVTRIKSTLPKKLTVQGNASSLDELFMILLQNAIQYSPDDSDIILIGSQTKDTVEIAISNGGKGISPEDLPHIFERFYRADKSRTNKSGYGLGLPLAKKIIDLHAGEIEITSKYNKNTTVKVSFKK